MKILKSERFWIYVWTPLVWYAWTIMVIKLIQTIGGGI